jgi:glycerophosphoryl diester phosphodiesterase
MKTNPYPHSHDLAWSRLKDASLRHRVMGSPVQVDRFERPDASAAPQLESVILSGIQQTDSVATHQGYEYLGRLIAARQTVPVKQLAQVRRTVQTPPTELGPRLTDPKDWHIPTLDETFKLAQHYPDKMIYLDAKTPNDPEVGRRMAQQIMGLLRKYPDLKDRVAVLNTHPEVLDAMKEEFKKAPDFRDFKNFSLDNDNLNDISPSARERSPLTGSKDNRYVSIGNPKNPLTPNDFDDLVDEVKKAKLQTTRRGSPHFGKKILAWTLNEPGQIRKLVNAGVDGILTDDPEMMSRTLDQMGLPKGHSGRPEIIAHRGGPNSTQTPENTLPRIEDGFRSSANAIEIDIVSAKDGAVVFHDNNPNGRDELARNLGLEADNKWRPVFPDIGSKFRAKRLDQLTISEIRDNYGFERNATSSAVANVVLSSLTNLARLPGVLLRKLGDFSPILGLAGDALNTLVNTVAKPLLRGAVQGVDKLWTGVWHGVLEVGGGLWKGFGNIFKGNIARGLGQIGTGIWRGGVKIVKGVADGLVSVAKGVVSVAKSIGKAVGGFFKGIFG